MSYERSGKVVVPQWWLDKVLPILDREPHAWLAQQASLHAGRSSPWGPDSIAKFRSGKVRTVEMANAISATLQVPQPFFTAPTEDAAIKMRNVLQQHQTTGDVDAAVSESRRRSRLDGFDEDGAVELRNAVHERARRVHSADGEKSGGSGRRARRADRGRS